jgi:hypothetical protein
MDLLRNESGLGAPDNKCVSKIEVLQRASFNLKKPHCNAGSCRILNYFLIAKIVEEMNNDTMDYIFLKMIKTPAKMTSSFAPISGNYSAFKNMEVYSKLVPNPVSKSTQFQEMSEVVGFVNIISTSSDLAKWWKYLSHKAPKRVVDLILQTYHLDYEGMINLGGLSTQHSCLGNVVTIGSNIDGYTAYLAYAKDHNTSFMFLTNNRTDRNRIGAIFRHYTCKGS